MKLWYFASIWLAIIQFSQSMENVNNIDDQFRLPETVIPKHYFLRIHTILEENNFKHISSVKIEIQCIKPANQITVHSHNLEIKHVKINSLHNHHRNLTVTNYELDKKYEFLQIYLNDDLVMNGWYRLMINFTGEITDDMTGYYRSSYKTESGHTRWIATTNFEPTSARRAFPCFDEPALRARFTIHLGHLEDLTSLSNMPLKYSKKEEDGSALVWDTFEDSLNMSTYLVAFTVHDFGFETTQKSNRYGNTTINVWTPKKSLQQVKFATGITPKILSFFEEYFDIAYPLTKSDMLAVPDFATGAMENWGLITFREASLLFVSGVSVENDKREIANTIAHEIAHYWFGNLVTIRWWTYLWLKEGFATYLANVAMANLFPEWEIYSASRLMEDRQSVYVVDALESSRPVSIPIHDPDTISEIYDVITYFKGSCVIRMMELFLGDDVLRAGLIHYLKKYEYDSTEPEDLWNSLTIAAHQYKSLSEKLTVNQIMDTWTTQAGFPLVNVVRDYTRGIGTITQRRYLENVEKHDDSCYWVPLTYTTREESDFISIKPKKWLPCPKQNITFEFEDSNSWVLFNVQASGLYRVNYDNTNWELLIEQLETDHKKINKINRVLLIDDIMQLAMKGHVDIKIAFDLIKYVRHDDEYATWSKVLTTLLTINSLMAHRSQSELIKAYISNLITPIYNKFGGFGKTKIFSEFYIEILSASCIINNPDCEQEANGIFLKWMKSYGKHPIPEQVRSIVYCHGIKNGGEEEWGFLWHHYLNSNVATEKNMILNALGCTQQHGLLVRYLELMIKKDSGIRNQDALAVFASVIANTGQSHIARLFFYENVKNIYEIQSPKGSEMGHYISAAANSLNNEKEYYEYRKFLEANDKYFKMAHLTINRTLEKLIIWQHWHENIYPKIVHFLEQDLQSESGNSEDYVREN